ncbi:MAG: exopolyphosphatase [Lachnospiraceae bacterium]
MALAKYAVIGIGSYELELKIYQITADKKIKIIENIRQVMELGRETYSLGKISFETIDSLCNALERFMVIIKEYKVNDYDAVATSGIREATNSAVVLDRIKVRTGIRVRILSNSEERLIDYKALSIYEEESSKFINDGTAYVDIGSGSVQISLVEKGALVATQNLMLGSIRIRELLYGLSDNIEHFDLLIDELINNDWQTFRKMILKDKEINNIIATGVQISLFAKKINGGRGNIIYTADEFKEECRKLYQKSSVEIMKHYGLTEEQTIMVMPTIKIYEKIINETGAEKIWLPCTGLSDGMAIDYGVKNKKIKITHDYNEDILTTAKSISKRYKANQPHINKLKEIGVKIFDATKKIHGLSDRERLLLEIAAMLHDCGKYISLTASSQCSYDIIMATEIIGLSHKEREMVANIVKYNTVELENTDDLTTVKLVAMLRVANALDRSHKQKFKDYRIELKDNQLVISVRTNEDITLEKGTLREKAEFFEEVFGVKPVLKQKKGI